MLEKIASEGVGLGELARSKAEAYLGLRHEIKIGLQVPRVLLQNAATIQDRARPQGTHDLSSGESGRIDAGRATRPEEHNYARGDLKTN